MPADEGRDEGRAGLRREQRLRRREAQGHVDHRAVRGQRLARLEAVGRQRHLDRDIVSDFPKHRGLAHHPVVIERDDLGRNRPSDHTGDFPDDLEEIAAGLLDERGVGGDSVEQARFGKRADFGDLGSVGKELHGFACASALVDGFVA